MPSVRRREELSRGAPLSSGATDLANERNQNDKTLILAPPHIEGVKNLMGVDLGAGRALADIKLLPTVSNVSASYSG